jgi:hypothetical protein
MRREEREIALRGIKDLEALDENFDIAILGVLWGTVLSPTRWR